MRRGALIGTFPSQFCFLSSRSTEFQTKEITVHSKSNTQAKYYELRQSNIFSLHYEGGQELTGILLTIFISCLA